MTASHRAFGVKKAPAVSDAEVALNGAELLLSMVEDRWASRNGDATKMESQLKARQELEKIEEQLTKLESIPLQNEDARRQIQQLHSRIHGLREEIATKFDAWRRTELARHPQRPHTVDYIERLFTDFSEIHGDRGFGDDTAMICGMARFHGQEVMLVGTEKGRDTKQRMYRNF